MSAVMAFSARCARPVPERTRPMNIDIHHHAIPEGFFDGIKKDELFGTTRFEKDENGVSWIVSTGPAHAGRPYRERYHRSMHDVDAIIADMDTMGLDVAAISPVPPTNPYGMPIEKAEKVCEILNQGLVEMARAKPDRLVALASV